MGPNTKVEHYMRNETAETCTIDGESPVVESCSFTVWLPSSMGHVKSRMNSRGPPRQHVPSSRPEPRFEPTDVEKSTDELWLGVKCQSNLELAGSPRNALRRSGLRKVARRSMGADTCPVPEALVNGGSNYNCPKVAKFLVGALIFNRYPVKRQFQAGSLTGAVTSQKANLPQEFTSTGRFGTSMSARRILERKYVPRVGLFAHRKRYVSWVQNVVRQFGPYPV
ncbi:unnamed protein product [Bathycoccus prasinos]